MGEHEDENRQGGSLLVWREGVPLPQSGLKPLGKETAQQTIHAIAATPYEGIWDPEQQQHILEEAYRGLTKFDVMIDRIMVRAAEGNIKCAEIILDRILGKPKQAVESVSYTMSYSEYLSSLADAEEQNNETVIDIQPDARSHGRSFTLEELTDGI